MAKPLPRSDAVTSAFPWPVIGTLLILAAMLVGVMLFNPSQPVADAPSHAVPALAKLPGLPSEAPVIAPVMPLPASDARAQNAAVAFLDAPIAPAPPFRFAGSAADRINARDCLALAAMAEAGPSDPGQRAVMQVVLNRARHPAFARTVCGVVFEGSQRTTGCQFTFTCDGSLARRYSEASWAAARRRADEMLGGGVYAPVGNATHYHTDWVFPYWSPKLVKLARVETHLFFRWPGFWGSGKAMQMAYRGGEVPIDSLIGGGRPAGGSDLAETGPMPPLPADTPRIGGGSVAMRAVSGKANFVALDGGTGADAALAMARTLCNAPGTCRVMGWRDRAAIPVAFPLPPAARASLSFSYSRDPVGTEIVLYDCQVYPAIPRDQCIPRAR